MQKEDLKNIVHDLEIFLDVIVENLDSIMTNIIKKYETIPVSDGEDIFMDYIEEDVSEIKRAVKVIRDKMHQIETMVNSSC